MPLLRAMCLISFSLLALNSGTAPGQDYPNKPIRIVTSGTGSSSDILARVIAPSLGASLGQPVIVDNRVGTIAPETVSRASPDGYTLLVGGNTTWIAPLMQHVNYDPVRDLSPISLLQTVTTVLVVPSSLPVKSVKELIVLAKSRPGELNYGISAVGGGAHLATELLKSLAGINIVQVNYKNVGALMAALLSNEVQVAFVNLSQASPNIKSGKLTGLGIGSGQPSALAPGLPTVAASGLSGFEAGQLAGLFAPAKTPAILVNRLNRFTVEVLKQVDVRQKFFNNGMETLPSTPAEFAATIKTEMDRWGKVIKEAGIKAE